MDYKQLFLEKLDKKTAVIGIVGAGYVGLPLAVAFAEQGLSVVAVDINLDRVNQINAGVSYIEDVPTETLKKLVDAGLLRASSEYAAFATVDAISICVPTPLSKTRDPNISYIMHATEEIVAHGVKGKLIVLESTTYPGTTEEVVLPYFTDQNLIAGKDFFLAFSPERIDPGRTDYTIHTTPKVIGGMTANCLETAVALYGTIVAQPVPVSTPRAAEMVKLLENTFRAVNIGLVNEMALMCDKLDIDVWEVVKAAATKPYGFMPFFPGPGLGGHCIPIDPLYLSWKLRTLNYTARFIELASEINTHMPDYVVTKINDALNDQTKPVKGSKILILGVAYKPNVNDARESPAIDILHLLQQRGAKISYHDPFVPEIDEEQLVLNSITLTDQALIEADCVVIVTHHSDYDWARIANTASLIVDTRNAIKEPGSATVISI